MADFALILFVAIAGVLVLLVVILAVVLVRLTIRLKKTSDDVHKAASRVDRATTMIRGVGSIYAVGKVLFVKSKEKRRKIHVKR